VSNYPAIPEPQLSLESLRESVMALKEAIENIVGIRGPDSTTLASTDALTSVTNTLTANINSINVTPANGSITNAKLALMAANTIKANLANSTAAATDITLTQLLDDILGVAQGSLIYRGASSWVPLTPGVSGQYLKTMGASADPVWTTFPNIPNSTWNRIIKTTSPNVTGGVYVDDPELQFNVSANKKYIFRVNTFLNATTLGAPYMSVNGPSSPTFFRAGSVPTTYTIFTYDADLIAGSATTQAVSWLIYGTVFNGPNAGTVAVRWKSESLVAYAGSWLEWAEVG
jgi:hypothetical protein